MAIQTITIGDLKNYKFYVPSYQRGYRWTEHEVTAFLDDISEFSTEGGKSYCIQPLMVKLRDDGSYEVVDGQQRLTTVYIFMKIAEQEIRSAVPPFEIEYETRSNSAQFLKSLSDASNLDKYKEKNIDFFHMASAYETMNKWLESQPDKSVAIQELNTKIRKSVFFIWYEIPSNSNPISIFTKVNLGKIPLTNAELIKALLLNKNNFSKDSKNRLHEDNDKNIIKRQTEISVAWDRIEQGLRDDSFWYFLNEKDRSGTRIDMLFELLAKEQNKHLRTAIQTQQNYFSFLVISAAMDVAKDKEAFVKNFWDEVEKLYDEFRDWYNDLDKYHIIGYLIASGVTISEIFTITRGKRKSVVMKDLLAKVKSVTGDYDLNTISYDTSNDRRKIRRLLLLFNIATLVCKSEKQYRFPFDIYKGETGEKIKWDIEHIHATADDTDEADDGIGNLTLLDAQTNRSYKDAPFDEKRKIIIERESKGLFVPLCTKNIFLKVYTETPDEMNIWNDNDKRDYIDAMKSTLNTFFVGGWKRD